jgi:hypothetical protein
MIKQDFVPPKGERTRKLKGGELEIIPFEQLPLHDSTWGLCTGADGKIYIGACGEMVGGLSVFILRYDPDTRELEYLCEVAPKIGEPPDNGRATQSKIHYCMIAGEDGLLYCATHASGAPLNHPIWRPWNSWDDERLRFSGAHLFSFDTRTNELVDFGIGPPREGSRAMAYDAKRRKLYGITWPRNHFYVYYIDERRYLDVGRMGDINPQAVWLDKNGFAYTTDDYGFILRLDPDTDELTRLQAKCPHEWYRNGWHNVPYDVVPSPDGETFFGIDWGHENYVWEFDPRKPAEKSITSYGRAFGPQEFRTDVHLEQWQIRGLVFGADKKLYYTGRCGWDTEQQQHLVRMDPATGERESLGVIDYPERRRIHVASATPDFYGNLYFAEAACNPTALYVYRPDYAEQGKQLLTFKDMKPWG